MANLRLDQLIRIARAYSHELWIDAINARMESIRRYKAAKRQLSEL